MEKLKLKHEQITKSLDRLYEAVVDFDEFEKYVTKKEDQDRAYRTYRDSMIQRFEFSVDLFWKYTKIYLEKKIEYSVKISAPKHVIRDACNARLISEKDTENILKMIDDRNMSSHIYKEEIADQIGNRIGDYYALMRKYVDKLSLM